MQFTYNFDINGADESDDEEVKHKGAQVSEAVIDDVEIDIVNGIPTLKVSPALLSRRNTGMRISANLLKSSTSNANYDIMENNRLLQNKFKHAERNSKTGNCDGDDTDLCILPASTSNLSILGDL